MPFKCQYCGEYFCAEHRLPEKHECPGLYAAASPYEKEMKRIREKIRREEEALIAMRSKERKGEALHMLIGMILVILIGLSLIGYNFSLPWYILSIFIGGFAASFLVHELSHKISAKRYGLRARFMLDPMGSLLTLITAIPQMPFKIIAPGAVVIGGLMSASMMGSIALAGPLSNIVLSAILNIVSYLTVKIHGLLWLRYVLIKLASLNAFIAFFNLLPFGQLDGRKIMAWSITRWVIAFLASIILLITGYIL